MTSPIYQLVLQSQQLHRGYRELFGQNPISGDGFRNLGTVVRSNWTDVVTLRRDVIRSDFSDEVIPRYSQSTARDHVPLETTALSNDINADVTDRSVELNIRGSTTISENAQREAAEIAAVPDPDSPAGQIAILAIIEKYQAKSVGTVEHSAAEQQRAGQRAATGGGATPGGLDQIGQTLASLLGAFTGSGGSGSETGNPLSSVLGGMPLNSLLSQAVNPDDVAAPDPDTTDGTIEGTQLADDPTVAT